MVESMAKKGNWSALSEHKYVFENQQNIQRVQNFKRSNQVASLHASMTSEKMKLTRTTQIKALKLKMHSSHFV